LSVAALSPLPRFFFAMLCYLSPSRGR